MGECADVALGTVVTTSDLLRYDLELMPGAINTFALIISSYTIVLALKTAKSKYTEDNPFKAPKLLPFLKDKKSAVRFYLLATFLLGSMFIVLKLIGGHLIQKDSQFKAHKDRFSTLQPAYTDCTYLLDF